MSGLDVEPEVPTEQARGIVFKNCTFAGNFMNQVTLSLYGLKNNTVDILFDGCTIGPTAGQNMGGLYVGGEENTTLGTVEFRNTLIQDTGDCGLEISRKLPSAASLIFNNVTLNGTAYKGHWPVIRGGGGLVFNNLTVIDSHGGGGRTWLMGGKADAPRPPIFNVTGSATVFTKGGDCYPDVANGSTGIDIEIQCFNATSAV
jgi:hypothetical protein